MSDLFVWSGIVICLTIALVYYIVDIYNSLQRLRNLIPEARSNIIVILAKRDDLIAQLLRIVKSYGVHENQLFANVSEDFGGSSDYSYGSSLVNGLASLRMQFPALRADHLYGDLMSQLSSVESGLQERREGVNSRVRAYNTYLLQFPISYVAKRFDFQQEEFIALNEIIPPSAQLENLARNCHS